MFPEKVIPLFVTNLMEGKKVPLYGDGMNVRDWLYVEDHCSAIDAIIHQGKIGETYCIGGNSEKSNKELTYKIIELMMGDLARGGEASLRADDYIDFVKDRPGHDKRYAINFSKIKNELGWEPKISFEEGLQKTIEWYKNRIADKHEKN